MSAGKRQREIKYNWRGNFLLAFPRSVSLSHDSLLHFIHKTYFQNGRGKDVKEITVFNVTANKMPLYFLWRNLRMFSLLFGESRRIVRVIKIQNFVTKLSTIEKFVCKMRWTYTVQAEVSFLILKIIPNFVFIIHTDNISTALYVSEWVSMCMEDISEMLWKT